MCFKREYYVYRVRIPVKTKSHQFSNIWNFKKILVMKKSKVRGISLHNPQLRRKLEE